MGERSMGSVAWNPVALDAALDAAEKRFWHDLWRTAVDDAFVEHRMDMVTFGPVQAALVAEDPDEQALNFILGAASPGAVEGGHLGDAVAWLESHAVEYRVPLVSGLQGAVAAEEWLARREHMRVESPARLLRDTSPPHFVAPPGIDVYERGAPNLDEGFPGPLAESLGLPSWTATFFFDLPGTNGWLCYCAAAGDEPLAYAAMLIDDELALLTLASRPRAEGNGDGQAAVLHRCIAEAAAAGCDTIVVAEAGSAPAVADGESLVRAGFEELQLSSTWRPRARVGTST